MQLLLFTLTDNRYAVHFECVNRIVRSVEVTHLPGSPEIISGVIKVGKDIYSVADLRRRFGLPPRDVHPSDSLVLANVGGRRIAFFVQSVAGVFQASDDEIAQMQDVVSENRYIEGVVKLRDGVILIHDLERFLSAGEQEALDAALRQQLENGVD